MFYLLLYYLNNNYIYCHLESSTTLLHSLIMNNKFNGELYVDHINRITTDNRKANLRLITQSDQNKNQSKQARNVILPLCNINIQDIPTFIWYIKKNGHHGDRLAVEIKNKYIWKTTSSKTLSIKCKLELAKKHLKNLINTNPDLFIGHCMNGELSDNGKQLENEYIEILKLAGCNYNKNDTLKNHLDEDLKELNEEEVKIIQDFEEIQIDTHSIPKYCYYIKSNISKGDGYCVTKLHSKQQESSKDWTTTKSKKVSTKEKYKQMTEYLNGNIYIPKQDIIIVKQAKKEKIKSQDKFDLFTKLQLIEIIQMKGNNHTHEAADYIKNNFNICIHRNFISKLWIGEDVGLSNEIINSQEYKNMLVNTVRKATSKKFTNEELTWIKHNNSDKSLSQQAKLFETQFHKTITKVYISKLKSDDL